MVGAAGYAWYFRTWVGLPALSPASLSTTLVISRVVSDADVTVVAVDVDDGEDDVVEPLAAPALPAACGCFFFAWCRVGGRRLPCFCFGRLAVRCSNLAEDGATESNVPFRSREIALGAGVGVGREGLLPPLLLLVGPCKLRVARLAGIDNLEGGGALAPLLVFGVGLALLLVLLELTLLLAAGLALGLLLLLILFLLPELVLLLVLLAGGYIAKAERHQVGVRARQHWAAVR